MIRTEFSFRVAFGPIREVHQRVCKDLQWASAPIADRNSTFGFVAWNKLCNEAGTKPIFGVELGLTPHIGEKKPTVDYWSFLAKDDLKPLHQLIARATSFIGKEPLLTYADAMKIGGVYRIAGPRARLDCFEPSPDTFVGLSAATNKGFLRQAIEAGHQFIAAQDNRFPLESDKETYRVALGWRSFTQTYPQWILTDDEWREQCGLVADKITLRTAISNRELIFKNCNAKLKQAELLKPEKPKTLLQMCKEGAKLLGCNLSDKIYNERLKRELALIKEKNFEDYFYILADLINWAKKRMIVGPARGSSCGSLVCYLLGITAIDPIPFGLIFERFIDVNRADLPDIDVDFSDERRDLVFGYAAEKYGSDRVARLGTIGMFKPRSALKQVGTILKIPPWMVERTLEGVTERSSGDSRAMLALEDALKETPAGKLLIEKFPEAVVAARLEGHANNAGQHAAGIVLTQKPIIEYVAINSMTKSTMCDKKAAEALNLLKIDALGLTQLSIFERCLELIGKESINGYLETLPLDDPAAFDILNAGKFSGIFQFTGLALKSLTKQVKIESLEDMVSITALARPGPMATGGANSWALRKMGREKITTLHPLLTELTKDTFGITIYQEQVMRIVRELGKFSWAETSAIRKAMSGRLGDEFFNKYWVQFQKGALESGIEERIAHAIWDQINTFGSWAFNKAHAVAYGIVSYWCCYLKAHHPIEFAAATLDAEREPTRLLEILRELKSEGIDYIPVDPEHSIDRWFFKAEGDRRTLVGPLTAIKGIGPAALKEIIDARTNKKPLRAALKKRLEGVTTDIDSLFPIADQVKKLHPNLKESANIVTKQTPVIDVQSGLLDEAMIIAVVKRIAPRDENDAQNVAKRGRRLNGPTQALNLFFQDDTDEMFCKVNRFKFEALGRAIIDRGKPGKAIYAVKGKIPSSFRMIDIEAIRYLGDME